MSNVAGLYDSQLIHVRAMVAEVKRLGLPQRAAVIVVETALVESAIYIYANWNVPDSLAIPHEKVGSDHASVGVLQQQVPSWGTARDCMDPATSTRKFLYGAGNNPGLLNLPGYRFSYVGYPWASNWTQIPTGAAAQAVQVSAFPYRYMQVEAEANSIVQAVWGLGGTIGVDDDMTPAQIVQFNLMVKQVAAINATLATGGHVEKTVTENHHAIGLVVNGDSTHPNSQNAAMGVLKRIAAKLGA